MQSSCWQCISYVWIWMRSFYQFIVDGFNSTYLLCDCLTQPLSLPQPIENFQG